MTKLPKDKRDELAKISFACAPKIGRRKTVEMIKAVANVSETTAQHIIRRGIFLSVNRGATK